MFGNRKQEKSFPEQKKSRREKRGGEKGRMRLPEETHPKWDEMIFSSKITC